MLAQWGELTRPIWCDTLSSLRGHTPCYRHPPMSAKSVSPLPSLANCGSSQSKSEEVTRLLVSDISLSGLSDKRRPPISLLKEYFEYDSRGYLLWKKAPERKPSFLGNRAGSIGTGNYRNLKLSSCGCRFCFDEHRAVWAMFYNYWPIEIDHINGDRQDNRIENLREVTRSENLRNARRRCTNVSGVTGVSWDTKLSRWVAVIQTTYNKYLGSFDSFEEAVAARKAAEIKYGYHPNHGRD